MIIDANLYFAHFFFLIRICIFSSGEKAALKWERLGSAATHTRMHTPACQSPSEPMLSAELLPVAQPAPPGQLAPAGPSAGTVVLWELVSFWLGPAPQRRVRGNNTTHQMGFSKPSQLSLTWLVRKSLLSSFSCATCSENRADWLKNAQVWRSSSKNQCISWGRGVEIWLKVFFQLWQAAPVLNGVLGTVGAWCCTACLGRWQGEEVVVKGRGHWQQWGAGCSWCMRSAVPRAGGGVRGCSPLLSCRALWPLLFFPGLVPIAV